MSVYDLGDPVVLALDVKVDGQPAAPDSVTLTITGPVGSTAVGVFTPSAATPGHYEHQVLPDVEGEYAYRWLTTGTGAGAETGGFTVGTPLVTLAEVKRHLNIPASDTSNDLELTLHLEAATALVEDYVGPVLPRTIQVTAGYGVTILAGRVISVSSVLSGGVAVTGYTLNAAAGLIEAPYGSVVTYVAGYSPVPAAIKLGVLEVVRALWSSQRGSFTPRFGEGEPEQFGELLPTPGDRLPPAALRLLRPYARGSVVA